MPMRLRGKLFVALAGAATLLAPTVPTCLAQVVAAAERPGAVGDLSRQLWGSARSGDWERFAGVLDEVSAKTHGSASEAAIRLKEHLAQREVDRAKRTVEVREQFAKALAGEQTNITLAKALRSATELQLLSHDKEAVPNEPEIRALIGRADTAAREAEAAGDILTSYELFALLGTLMEEAGTYKPDVRRLSQRLEMIRLYVPETLWQMRAARQKAAGDEPLPPYNKFGDDYQVKLASIDKMMLLRAIGRTRQHIEQQPLSVVVLGALEAVKTMATTVDLRGAFPGLGDQAARLKFVEAVEAEQARLGSGPKTLDPANIEAIINRVRVANDETIRVPVQALYHEMGNGAMSKLDEFSAVIWPDELRRFNKMTQSSFVGVGVQIEYDEQSNIRVVTPLEGTPAQRAGVHPGDVLKRVDGRDIFGLSLDQAVDVITGPEGTKVTLTMERKIDGATPDEKGATPAELKDFTLTRSIINVASVKGWKRTGVKEDDWDWFIDKDAGIGYVRLTQFADNTGREFDAAIKSMRKSGLNALVLDLRFNPGGLLDQAVRISRRFINTSGGYVVMMQGPGGVIDQPEYAMPSQATLASIPVIVLINEGSASASEIVSGAVQAYQKGGPLDGTLDLLVLGARSYGKGSVQNVWELTADSRMKVTTAYYMLPDKRIIHRRPGAVEWGVEPNLKIEMLPKQTVDALTIRRNSDVVALDETGQTRAEFLKEANPDDLLSKGIDLQLETAVVLLKGKIEAAQATQAAKDK